MHRSHRISTLTTTLVAAIVMLWNGSIAQTTIAIDAEEIESAISSQFQPGVFYVPKTEAAQNEFLSSDVAYNAIRLNIIESALNNASNLEETLAFLDNVSSILQQLSDKTDRLVFIFEKMPAWLSSSTDGSPAATPGWFVLNTKPPASWDEWQAMVELVVDRIVNSYGIQNAYFEIWNEPDLGSWTASKEDYFQLFQVSYDAIKSVNTQAPVGGPATNHWGKNIDFNPPYGYLNNQIAESSLIAELIDSSAVWNKPLDFISWHLFDVSYQSNQNAIDFITAKYAFLGLTLPELMVSEWNTPSIVRDTPLQKAFFVKNELEMISLNLQGNMIAAWQDFEGTSEEFHGDYGLLTYGAIHKPAYKALLLWDQLRGNLVNTSTNAPADVLTTVSFDTLRVLIANYTPPPFIEAFNHTLFEGQFNAEQLDSAAFIDIENMDFSALEAIYQGNTVIENTTSLNSAINNSISTYTHLDSLQTSDRSMQLNVGNLSGTHAGLAFILNSTTNNLQFHYDSLISEGYTQTDAIDVILADQSLTSSAVTMTDGTFQFTMEPNAVHLYQFLVPEWLMVQHLQKVAIPLVYPNPTIGACIIQSDVAIGTFEMVDTQGRVLKRVSTNDFSYQLDLEAWPNGMYVLRFLDLKNTQRVCVVK